MMPITIGISSEGRKRDRPTIPAIIAIAKQAVCRMCADDAKGLQAMLSEMADTTIRAKIRRGFSKGTSGCVNNNNNNSIDTSGQQANLKSLLQQRPCAFFASAKCVSKRINAAGADTLAVQVAAAMEDIAESIYKCPRMEKTEKKEPCVDEPPTTSSDTKPNAATAPTGIRRATIIAAVAITFATNF